MGSADLVRHHHGHRCANCDEIVLSGTVNR
jgi:hypothetical protein